MGKDVPGAIDTWNEYLVFSLVLLVLGVLLGGSYLYQNPNFEDKIYALNNDRPDFSGEEIVFNESYDDVDTVESINKVYSDTDTEFGWCMRVEGEDVEKFDTFKLLNKTTPGNIRFSCNSRVHNAIMHTHPDGSGYRGVTALSGQDEDTLRDTSWIDVSCVVGGEISNSSSGVEGVGCWNIIDGEIHELEIEFH